MIQHQAQPKAFRTDAATSALRLAGGRARARRSVTGRWDRRLLSTACFLALICCCWAPAGASADALLPPGHGVFTGSPAAPTARFRARSASTRRSTACSSRGGARLESAFGQARYNHARLMLHISTTQGYGAPEQITPRGIAQGGGDGYLLTPRRTRSPRAPTRLRPPAARDGSGQQRLLRVQQGRLLARALALDRELPRGVAARRDRPARRSCRRIDSQLRALGLPRAARRRRSAPRCRTARSRSCGSPRPTGRPTPPPTAPAAYYPGDAYVDWVGTDFYSLFPNFSGLQRFY